MSANFLDDSSDDEQMMRSTHNRLVPSKKRKHDKSQSSKKKKKKKAPPPVVDRLSPLESYKRCIELDLDVSHHVDLRTYGIRMYDPFGEQTDLSWAELAGCYFKDV